MTDANGWPEEAREAAKRALEWGQMNADGSTDDDDWVERILGSLAPFVASRAATAAQAMREACARRVDDDGIGDPRERQLRAYLAGQVRALPIPAPAALAREIAAAEDRGRAEGWKAGMQVAANERREGMERAAGIAEKHALEQARLSITERGYNNSPDQRARRYAREHQSNDIAAAIRAAAKEGNP